jgi:hypothetical protein
MPKEIDPRPAVVPQPQQPNLPPRPSGGKNLRVLHTNVDSWPKGHVIAPEELGHGANVKRLVALGAVVETDDPATGPLENANLPPGAAVTHQLSPGDELPPNTLETGKESANLDDMTVTELHQRASDLDIPGRSELKTKDELLKAIKAHERRAAK